MWMNKTKIQEQQEHNINLIQYLIKIRGENFVAERLRMKVSNFFDN